MTPEECREYKKQWRAKRKNDPEYQAKRAEEAKRYYERHRDEINEKRRANYQTDPAVKQKVSLANKERWKRIKSDPVLKEENNKQGRVWYQQLSQEKKRALRDKQREWLYQNPERHEKYKRRKNNERHRRYQKQLAKAVCMLGGKCQICGLIDHPIIYDFHHRDPTLKSFAIGAVMGYVSWSKLEEELRKCDLLCSHCHRKVTHGIEPDNWDGEGKREGQN